jgi:hypothetical protein
MAITHSLLLYVNISVNGLPCIECSNWRCNMYRDYCNNYHRKQLLVALPTLVCNCVKLITSFLSLRKCFKLVEYENLRRCSLFKSVMRFCMEIILLLLIKCPSLRNFLGNGFLLRGVVSVRSET